MPAVYRVDRRENTPELRLWLDNEASPARSDSGTEVETHSSLPASLPSSPAPHPIPFFSFFCFPPRPPASNLRCFCVPFPGSRARLAVINCARVAGHSRRTTSDVLPPPRVRLRISEKRGSRNDSRPLGSPSFLLARPLDHSFILLGRLTLLPPRWRPVPRRV